MNVACTGAECGEKKDASPVSEELQRIHEELEQKYVFVLKKVENCSTFDFSISIFVLNY